jgi:hypothetical protein
LRIQLRIVSLVLLLLGFIYTYGQHSLDQKVPSNSVSVKQIEFIVSIGDNIKDIAAKINIPAREILSLNKIHSKHYMAYPGRRLILPVQVQQKVWDPSRDEMSGNFPSREDRGGNDNDYELVIDSNNYRLSEDFIDLSEAESDSTEYENIAGHLQKIDKQVRYLYHKLDSMKATDFKFDFDDQDKNSVLYKMKQTRDQYYAESPISKQIDSLKDTKIWLGQRRIVLRNQRSNYENLVDNATYEEAHYQHDEKRKTDTWGDHLVYESMYLRSKEYKSQKAKANAKDTVANIPPPPIPITSKPIPIVSKSDPTPSTIVASKPDTLAAQTPAPILASTPTDKQSVAKISAPTNTETVVDKTAKTNTEVISSTSVPIVAAHQPVALASTPPEKNVKKEAPVTNTQNVTPPSSVKITERENTTSEDADMDEMPHYKSDFSVLPKQKFTAGVRSERGFQRSLDIIKFEPALLKTTVLTPLDTAGIETGPHKVSSPAIRKTTTPQAVNFKKRENSSSVGIQQKEPNKLLPSNKTINKTTASTANTSAKSKESTKQQNIATTTEKTVNKSSASTVKKETKNPSNLKPKEPPKLAVVKAPTNNPDNTLSAKIVKAKSSAPSAQNIKADTTAAIIPPKQIAKIDTPIRHESISFDAASTHSTGLLTSTDKPSMSLYTKIDTTIDRPEKEISTDPLASYKTDSDFAVKRDVQIKDIPVTESKNKPKYLMPVDSVEKIKGDFYLIRARQVLERGDFKTGDKYLRKSLELDPSNAQSWMLHADLFLTLGLADQALKEYEISGEIDSTNPKVFYNIALLYVKANNNQKAYKYFSKSIEVNYKYLSAYMGRASLLMDERDYQGAIQDYDKLLAINKYYSPAFKARGLAKMELHKFADAVLDFNQYLEIEDPDGYVIYQRGISKIYSNDLLQGCLDLSSSLELGFKEAEKAIKKFCE